MLDAVGIKRDNDGTRQQDDADDDRHRSGRRVDTAPSSMGFSRVGPRAFPGGMSKSDAGWTRCARDQHCRAGAAAWDTDDRIGFFICYQETCALWIVTGETGRAAVAPAPPRRGKAATVNNIERTDTVVAAVGNMQARAVWRKHDSRRTAETDEVVR